jgi:transposase-like protein
MTQFVRAATTKLTADKRKAIAIQALARSASISALAADNGVSRPLIYREVDKARAALDDAFSPTQTDDADKAIFSGSRARDLRTASQAGNINRVLARLEPAVCRHGQQVSCGLRRRLTSHAGHAAQ